MQVPKFIKNPRLVGAALVILWLCYFFYANIDQAAAISVFPLAAKLVVRLWALVLGAMLFGCLITLAIQGLWRRRHVSKELAQSTIASEASNKTSA